MVQFWWRSGSRFGSGSPKSEIRMLRIGGGLWSLSISSSLYQGSPLFVAGAFVFIGPSVEYNYVVGLLYFEEHMDFRKVRVSKRLTIRDHVD